LLQPLRREDSHAAALDGNRLESFLVAEDAVDGRPRRAGDLGQLLLGQRDRRPVLGGLVGRDELQQRPADI
jgi:hypothetical protein